MHLSLVTQAIATVLRTSGVLRAACGATGDTDAKPRPFLAITIEDIQQVHPHLISASIVFAYHFDADDPQSGPSAEAAAAADLQAAVDHLLSDTGNQAAIAAIRPHGMWLRSLRYPRPAVTDATGERSFSHTITIPAWIQTAI